MSEKSRRDILDTDDRGVGSAENPLALLFRTILQQLDVNPFKWSHLLDRYLKDPRNGIPQTPKDRSSTRGNINKELRKPKITFSTFIKGLLLLNPVSARFEVHLTWPNKTTTIHGVNIALRRPGTSNQNEVTALSDQADELLNLQHSHYLEDSVNDDDDDSPPWK